MKKVVYPSSRIKASTKIQAARGTIDEMLDAFENRIDELENGEAVNLSTEVTASYELHDSYEAPQAGEEVLTFADWYELQDYLDENPDVEDRINNGYACIVECSNKETAKQCIEAAHDEEYPKGYFDEYYGQTAYEEYGDLVSQECSGMVISKRRDQGEEPGGLIYEADQLGIEDPFDLLKCLEGMCYNNKAVEISDYQYKVL
jgi:hypothetical protein